MNYVMYMATYALDIASLCFLIGLVYSSIVLSAYRKKAFLIGIVLTIIIILAEAGTVLTGDENYSFRSINILFNLLGFALTPVLPLVLTMVFDRGFFRKYRILLAPTVINLIVTLFSPISGFVFYVDANNHYFRQDYFFLFIIVYTINLLILFNRTIEVGKQYNYLFLRKMVALALFTLIGTSFQLISPLAYSSWHCVTLSLFLFFLVMSEFDSNFDQMTGLYNRAAFERAKNHIGEDEEFCVILIDINDFKSVNDTYGHEYGDDVIKTVATKIRKSFDKNYTCYRYGGDEFTIIGKETDVRKIDYQLKKMESNLSEIREHENPLPTVSYGYSVFRRGENLDFNKILKDADDQMYHFKKTLKGDGAKEKI